ncbi:hypothetical protein [Pseudonocardia parietis]|uniref:Uncharacterized protein n=1 Tax=Pseudonocardia parietis TaxID=570936 RepID=A0ABS4W6U1_9PSEU|nr:hypothetical protein [Pseudonocardia parietis]MBP2371926.1 hypothetical protein [Pseudonocardia parietis]
MKALQLVPRPRVDPEEFAGQQTRRFTDHRLRIGRSGVVHEVAWRSWLGDLVLPVPACHQGWSGFAAADDLTATDDPATCRKCAHGTGLRRGEVQPALFELDQD